MRGERGGEGVRRERVGLTALIKTIIMYLT